MPRRASATWVWPIVRPVVISWRGPWERLEQLGWGLLERQRSVPRYLRYPQPGDDLLTLVCDAADEPLCRQIGARADLSVRRLATAPEAVAQYTTPFTLEALTLAPATPGDWLPGKRRASLRTLRREAFETPAWFVIADTVDACYARSLLADTSIPTLVYATSLGCVTYLRAGRSLRASLHQHHLAPRQAHGLPHGHLPLSAVAFQEPGLTRRTVAVFGAQEAFDFPTGRLVLFAEPEAGAVTTRDVWLLAEELVLQERLERPGGVSYWRNTWDVALAAAATDADSAKPRGAAGDRGQRGGNAAHASALDAAEFSDWYDPQQAFLERLQTGRAPGPIQCAPIGSEKPQRKE